MFSNIWDGRVPEGDKDESRWGEINREGDVHHSGIHRESSPDPPHTHTCQIIINELKLREEGHGRDR